MTGKSWIVRGSLALAVLAGFAATASAATADSNQSTARITILYDAFGNPSSLQKDWGYSALVEYSGKRILFDTGNNPDILENNAKAKGVNLKNLDFVVMSHRHGDHMGGLSYLLSVNPTVKIYAPMEGLFGVYGGGWPGSFYRKEGSLPPEQRYFQGTPPDFFKSGTPWPHANFQLIDKDTEIAPDIHLISVVSDKPGTLELHELSLALTTPEGLVIVVACSHPGIEKVLQSAAAINPRIHFVAGGFHLLVASDAEIEKVVTALRDQFKVEYLAPGHCTGEPAFVALKKAFGERYLFAGLGSTLDAGTRPSSSMR